MENDEHRIISNFSLCEPMQWWLAQHGLDAFVSSNSPLRYSDDEQPLGPDFYLVLGVPKRRRKQYDVKHEGGRMPCAIVELLSPSTQKRDRVLKFGIYRDVMKVTDYFLYDSDKARLEGYTLVKGEYVLKVPNAHGHLECASVSLALGVRGGTLRWFDRDGKPVPTAEERAGESLLQVERERLQVERERSRLDAERERADAEHARADAERQRANAERERADAERTRAEDAERELQDLKRRLKELQDD